MLAIRIMVVGKLKFIRIFEKVSVRVVLEFDKLPIRIESPYYFPGLTFRPKTAAA